MRQVWLEEENELSMNFMLEKAEVAYKRLEER